MRAVILAGGKGTRLLPYTTVFPKPLMPIGDMPILEIVIRQLRFFGFTQIKLSVGHLAELIMAYFDDGNRFGLNIEYSKEDKPLGPAGPLPFIPKLGDTFLVMNGDVLTTLDFNELHRYHLKTGAAVTIAIHERSVNIDLGMVESDETNRIVGYIEKPTHCYKVSMGIYIFERRVLNYISPGEYLDFPDLVLRLLAAGEKIMGYPYHGYWLDIGRADDYAQAIEEFEGMRDQFMLED